jgi:hypothetical protein
MSELSLLLGGAATRAAGRQPRYDTLDRFDQVSCEPDMRSRAGARDRIGPRLCITASRWGGMPLGLNFRAANREERVRPGEAGGLPMASTGRGEPGPAGGSFRALRRAGQGADYRQRVGLRLERETRDAIAGQRAHTQDVIRLEPGEE